MCTLSGNFAFYFQNIHFGSDMIFTVEVELLTTLTLLMVNLLPKLAMELPKILTWQWKLPPDAWTVRNGVTSPLVLNVLWFWESWVRSSHTERMRSPCWSLLTRESLFVRRWLIWVTRLRLVNTSRIWRRLRTSTRTRLLRTAPMVRMNGMSRYSSEYFGCVLFHFVSMLNHIQAIITTYNILVWIPQATSWRRSFTSPSAWSEPSLLGTTLSSWVSGRFVGVLRCLVCVLAMCTWYMCVLLCVWNDIYRTLRYCFAEGSFNYMLTILNLIMKWQLIFPPLL